MDETTPEQERDNPEAVGESSPYVEIQKGELTQKQLMEKLIRDRGRGFVMLFVLVLVLACDNFYQRTLPKNVPYIHNVDSHGQVVTRILLRPDEVPPDDPNKQSFIRNRIKEYVENARIRSIDTVAMVKGINSALRESAGPARIKLSTEVRKENLTTSPPREFVEILMSKLPVPLAGNTWQAEWQEVVRTVNNVELRRETWSGSFLLAEQLDWVDGWNAYGVRIVDRSWAPLSK